MRRLFLHLGFLVPLLLVCASFMLLKIANESTDAYEKALNKDYAVIIISSKSLEISDFINISKAATLSELDTSDVLKRLQNQLSEKNIKTLKSSLPHFYSLNFKEFMSEAELNAARSKIEQIAGVKRVQMFSKTHTKVYHLLLLLRAFVLVASIIIAILCWVLFSKQTRIWVHEHAERMYILQLFGASFFGRCSFLLKMVLFNCILCYLLLLALFLNFENFAFIRDFYAQLDAPIPQINAASELGLICLSAAIISVFAVLLVLKRAK